MTETNRARILETIGQSLLPVDTLALLRKILDSDDRDTLLVLLGIDATDVAPPKPETIDVMRAILDGDRSLEPFEKLGFDIGSMLAKKNRAYGNSFEESGKIIEILFPNGVPKGQYQDFLTITRIIDKLFRIATEKDAFDEDPWRDIAGYAILSLWSRERAKK